MAESPLNAAVRQFEAVEANLLKLEKALDDAMAHIPGGVAFGEDPSYDRAQWTVYELLESLPAIDGWKLEFRLMELNEIAQRRLDANEIGEIEFLVSVNEDLEEPARLLRAYRHRFDKKRRQLVRDAILEAIDTVDDDLRRLSDDLDEPAGVDEHVEGPVLQGLNEHVCVFRPIRLPSPTENGRLVRLIPAAWSDSW